MCYNNLFMLTFCLLLSRQFPYNNGNLFDTVKSFFSPLEQFDIFTIIPVWILNFEFTITNLTITLIAVVVLGFIFFYFFFEQKLLPKGWQIILENIYLVTFRIVTEQIGHVGFIYFPFLLALFTWILFLNLFSMLPYAFAATSHLVWTLYFSLSICLGIFFVGILGHGIKFLKLFVPEVPLALYPLMITIEILSYIIRSFSLAIRLSANIIAGHTLVHILAEFVSVMFSLKKMIAVLPYVLLFAIFVLELGVACLQAYIFVTLICMYLNDSIHLAEH